MSPATPIADDEDAFMSNLLSGLNDSFFDAVPSPDPSPVKPKPPIAKSHPVPHCTPLKSKAKPTPNAKTEPGSSYVTGDDVDMAALMDGAEDWNWDDMESDFLTPKKDKAKNINSALSKPVRSGYQREPCTRCVVEQVIESQVDGRFQKTLTAKIDCDEERLIANLLDDWAYTDIRVGDTINLIGTLTPLPSRSSSSYTTTSAPPPSKSITLTTQANLLILHPDILLTATALSSAPTCARKPLLSMLVHSGSDITPSLVWGNVLHEVMQSCLREGRWDSRWIDERIRKVVRGGESGRGLGDLVKLGVSIEEAIREVKARAGGLKAFGEKYMASVPKQNALLTDTRSREREPTLLAITQLHDVEEDIWSPTYGLKGKLDATVQALISSPPSLPTQTRSTTTHPTPLEIKTGRAIAGTEHRAQTLLYTLLASERYATPVPAGLLYYTQSEEVVKVPANRNEIRALLAQRNLLAGFVVRRSRGRTGKSGKKREVDIEEPFLPATLDSERVCGRCYALDTCMLYRKAVEKVEDKSSAIAGVYELKTGHITPSQGEFFKTWENLISLEEQDMIRFKKELWSMGAKERESYGRCFSDMVLKSKRLQPGVGKPGKGIHQFTYTFVRGSAGAGVKGGPGSLLNGQMSFGDAIAVSVEPDLLALARGFIVELTPHEVVVGVDHELSLDMISSRVIALRRSAGDYRVVDGPVVFRIDKDEMSSGMGRVRDNLARLFYVDGDSKRLSLVVDLAPPSFVIPPKLPSATAHLNPSQQSAISKVLSAKDYALILGMPGTGKTTVLAALIRILVRMGKTVLLTSYTHSAVDTILAKMVNVNFGILRLGNVDKIHPDVKHFTLESQRTPTTVEQYEQQLMTPPVVATTCLSIDHALFSRRKFDYCIVDEASQITLPTCLGPLRFADKFVLVGDHFQLPPLVKSPAARKGGLDVSLFRRLSTAHPQAVVDLTLQYRMNEDIMLLSNRLIYGDLLKCGNEEVAKRSLVLPDGGKYLGSLHPDRALCRGDCWIKRLMSESCKAVFVDTDLLGDTDTRIGDLVQNPTEASLVYQVAETLIRSGVPQSQLGIISLYRQQNKLLSHLLHERKEVEILTADRSQGRDKECIIISMVRSNDAGQTGDLVKDWRRMNVSFTRACSKLIIIGSRKTLKAAPLLSQFFALMEGKGWILPLPVNAHQMHSNIAPPSLDVQSSGARKRVADEKATEKENIEIGAQKSSIKKVKRTTADEGIFNGRPILHDVFVGGK